MTTTLTYPQFSALYTRGIFPAKGTRFEQPDPYEIAQAERRARDDAFERRVIERGHVDCAGDMPDRACARCGQICSPIQCGSPT